MDDEAFIPTPPNVEPPSYEDVLIEDYGFSERMVSCYSSTFDQLDMDKDGRISAEDLYNFYSASSLVSGDTISVADYSACIEQIFIASSDDGDSPAPVGESLDLLTFALSCEKNKSQR